MTISVQRFQADKYTADATVVFVPQDEAIFTQQVEQLTGLWQTASAVFDTKDFTGARDSSTVVYTGTTKSPRLIIVGIGETSSLSLERLRRAAAMAGQKALSFKCQAVAVIIPTLEVAPPDEVVQAIVEGMILGTYTYDKYFTTKGEQKKIEKLSLLVEGNTDIKDAKKGAAIGEAVSNGVVMARDLGNAPSNELYPETLVERAKELQDVGVKVTALDKKQIQKLGMGGLLGVNQGSLRPPFFIILEWNGGKRGAKPIVLVGKGITFDSGGISIKPAAGMSEMKMDMGGAAAVIGTMRAIAELDLPQNVIALVPTTENMPSGSAYKPGDVLTFLNGKTAEIDNTDAEGRLVLADALSYADRYQPQAVIDVATLTGACVIALGSVASALLSNDEGLKSRIEKAGERTFDRVVELPLWEEYEELIKSEVADVKNSGGRAAGTITAALFLQHFIGSYPWAHLDIAGTGMGGKGVGYTSKGATGVPVRLLVDLIRNWD